MLKQEDKGIPIGLELLTPYPRLKGNSIIDFYNKTKLKLPNKAMSCMLLFTSMSQI